MDWSNELKQLETEIRNLPKYTISLEKNQKIFQELQKAVRLKKHNHRRQKIFTTSVLSAACIAFTVLGISLHNSPNIISNTKNMHIQGAQLVQKGAVFTLPAIGTSQNWEMELVSSHSTSPNPVSIPEKPRYDLILRYKGTSAQAKNVVLVERGIGIWKPNGSEIPSEVMEVGTIKGRQTVYQNFSILPQASKLSFTISWLERGKNQTEEINIHQTPFLSK